MKITLLSFILFALSASLHAQNLPLFENFNNSSPNGWDLKAAKIKMYDRNVNAVCTSGQGLVSNPSVGSNGNNLNGFVTGPLQSVTTGSSVVVGFNGYVYRGNRLRCADQLFATTPCSGVAQVKLLSARDGSVLGVSNVTQLNLSSGFNVITTPVNVALPNPTAFKVLLDISHVNCAVNGSVRYVIDDVFISEGAGGPLPVTLKTFNANRADRHVNLNWITSTEQNNLGFYVQRFTTGTWENLVFVPSLAPAGTSNIELSYSFKDINNFTGVSQYRILQVDQGGKERLSETRSVRGKETGKTMIFPNPSNDGNVNMLFDAANRATYDITIIDLTGKIVKRIANVNSTSLRIYDLEPGYYNVRIFNNTTGIQVMEKIVVLNR